jgi:putative DNA primase/helicase
MFEFLPDELKKFGLFCGWKLTERGKIPFNLITGSNAKSNDRSTFCGWDKAESLVKQYIEKVDGKMLGGLGLGIFNGFSAVDIDHCVDKGKINDFAQGLIDYFQSYTEFSPSGTGIRIIFKTDDKVDKEKFYINNSKIGLEIYVEGSTNKFVTLTGNAINSYLTDIVKVDIKPILNQYMTKTAVAPNRPVASIGVGAPDIRPFLNRDAKLNQLWNATAPGSHSNESETDLALCDKLAFYLGNDSEAVNSAFISSPYFKSKDELHTKKWLERSDYREATLKMACQQKEIYNPHYSDKADIIGAPKTAVLLDYTDTGNASAFIQLYGDTIRYNVDNKCWMIWNGKYWQNDVKNDIKQMADSMLDQMKQDTDRIINDKEYRNNLKYLLSKSGKDNMIEEAQHLQGIATLNSDYDQDKYMFNCRAGVMDLRDLSIKQPSQDLMLSKYADVEIDKREPKKFNKFMAETFKGEEDLISYVETLFALCLTGDTSEQKIWFFVGDGNNGKSVLAETMMNVLGDYAAKANPELILDKKYQSQAFSEVARLKGKRLVFVSETKLGDKLNESMVKEMTGGENIVARFLYCNEFEFKPEFKMIMMSNYEPIIRGTDNGIWRRTKIIRFKNIVPDDKINLHLVDELIAEKNQIFWLLLKKYIDYKKTGLIEPETVKAETKMYRTDMDLVAKWIDENCELANDASCPINTLWMDFDTWLTKRKEFQLSQTLFCRNLSKKFDKVRKGGQIVYLGIKLK